MKLTLDMKRIILALSFLMVLNQACAPNDSSDASYEKTPPAPVVTVDPGDPNGPPVIIPQQDLCRRELSCQYQCNTSFRFTTDQEIARKYAANGGGALFKAIAENRLAILNHDTCMNTPLNEVADFLYSPYGFEALGQVKWGGACYYFEANTWKSCN